MQKELDSTESIESSLAPVFMTTVLVLWFSLKWYLFSYIHQELKCHATFLLLPYLFR